MAQLLIDLVPVGEPEVGYWCDLCLLPSVIRWELAMADHFTLLLYGRVAVAQCAQCETYFVPEH